MASWTTMNRDILTIFLVVSTISGTIFGLPLAGIDGENNDGQMFPANMPPPPPGAFANPGVEIAPPKRLPEPRSDDAAPLSVDGGLDPDTPAEVAGVDGTGLAMMAGPVVPGGNTGNMFPDNMSAPPPGALNDEAPQFEPEVPQLEPDVPASNGNMFPDNMPAPPPGALNDEVPQLEPEVPSSNGNMFPDNMPAPPPGALNDEVPQMELEVPASNGNMFPDNMPPPPPGAFNDEAPQLGQVVPVNNGNMFPANIPPPPPGALNDEVPQLGQVVPVNNGNMFPDNMPPPPPVAVNDEVPQLGQVVPVNNGNMFPDNMPPPPNGAFNDEAAVPFLPEGIEPRQMEMNQNYAALPNQEPVSQFQGMFPPNMPPPPPGAFNEPPPIPKLNEEKPSNPALPSDDTVVEPVYVTKMKVPEAAIVQPGDQTPFIDPNQRSPVPSNQQDIPINTTQYNPDNISSNNENTSSIEPAGDPQERTPNTQESAEGQVPYNPDELDESSSPIPNTDNQSAESVPNQNEVQAPVNPNISNSNPNTTPQVEPDQDIPENPVTTDEEEQSYDVKASETSYESYESYEEEQNNVGEEPNSFEEQDQDDMYSEEWDSHDSESDSEYSFMDFLESVMDSSDYEYTESGKGEDDDTLWENTELEDYSETDSSYLEYSSESEYSDLEWIFNSDDEPSLGESRESSEEEEDDDGRYFGGDQTEEAHHHEEEQTYPEYIDAFGEDDLYRNGGTKLIMYCIPAIILTVLVLLAWKNYKGRIRVVAVQSVDAKRYDWKSDRKSEEHAPMLLDQDEREY